MMDSQLSKNAQRAIAGECFCFAARKQARLLTRLYDAALTSHGVTSGQFSMLAAIAGAGAMTIQTLADLMGTDHSTTSRGVASLIQSGLLATTAHHSDGRKRVLHLTASGLEILNTSAEAWAEVQAKVAQGADLIVGIPHGNPG